MKSYIPLLFSASFFNLCTTAMGRKITVYNNCPFTIWPAMHTGAGSMPDQLTGWAATAYSSVSFTAPDDWNTGSIWGRRDCTFNNAGTNNCLDGGCPSGTLLCYNLPGPPVTIGEFTLSNDPNTPDQYDVSLVNGYNLPMRIDNTVGCGVASCGVDLGPNCPAALKGPFDSSGFPVGCNSACDAGLASDPKNDPNCCTGIFNSAATCPPTSVQYYSYFKTNCPNSFVYAQDQQTGTAVYTCSSASRADYTVTFCP